MSISVSENAGVVTINLNAQFIFTEHRAFRDAYVSRKPGTKYVIDFKWVTYMDSAALGMLLLINEHNGANRQYRIQLMHCNAQIKKMFEVANFGQFFDII